MFENPLGVKGIGDVEHQKGLTKSPEIKINSIMPKLGILRDNLYHSCVKKFSSHRTIPPAAFRCGRVSPVLTKRFSNPTTTLFQYWAVIPDILVLIFLENPVISPHISGSYQVDIRARYLIRAKLNLPFSSL